MTTTEVAPAPTNDHLETRHSDEDSYSTAEEEELMLGSSGESDEDEGDSIGEREEGDGQESIPNKALDDDEDKKNPQYIPKRGGFYEHDDRLEPGEEAVVQKPKEVVPQRKPSRVAADRWLHDRYDERQQAPKSEEELIATYGYDIRKGDGAPRARRRRRYGGGPKQYTRSWEDEEAYRRNLNATRGGSRRTSRVGKHPETERENGPPRTDDNQEFPSLGGKEDKPRRQEKPEEVYEKKNIEKSPVNYQEKKEARKQSEDKNHVRRKSSEKNEFQRQDNGPQRGGRPLRGRSKVEMEIPPGAEEEALQKGIEGLHVTEQGSTYQKAELPPRLQEAANRPKRYSTQRLQTGSPAPSLVTVIPQPSPPMVLAAAMGSAFGSATGVRVTAPAFYDQAAFQQPPQASALPNFAPPFSSAPAFHVPFPNAPPPVPLYPPADFVASGATAAAFAGVPQDQLAYQQGLFSSQQTLPPAQEVYQGGVTYYAPQGHIPVTQIIQKRPNAAIPIIAPPELEPRSERRETQTEENIESDNKDGKETKEDVNKEQND